MIARRKRKHDQVSHVHTGFDTDSVPVVVSVYKDQYDELATQHQQLHQAVTQMRTQKTRSGADQLRYNRACSELKQLDTEMKRLTSLIKREEKGYTGPFLQPPTKPKVEPPKNKTKKKKRRALFGSDDGTSSLPSSSTSSPSPSPSLSHTANPTRPSNTDDARALDCQTIPQRRRRAEPRIRERRFTQSLNDRVNVEQQQTRLASKTIASTVIPLHDLETCVHCHGQMHFEDCRRVCQDCGMTASFLGSVMERKREEFKSRHGKNKSKLSVQHLHKFLRQYQVDYPSITSDKDLLEKLCVEYYKVHVPTTVKINSNLTKEFTKKHTTTKVFKRAPERISLELAGELIPEFTHTQLQRILNDRFQIYLAEIKDNQQSKNFTNNTIVRELSRANGFRQGILFKNPKTNSIHTQRHADFARLARQCKAGTVTF